MHFTSGNAPVTVVTGLLYVVVLVLGAVRQQPYSPSLCISHILTRLILFIFKFPLHGFMDSSTLVQPLVQEVLTEPLRLKMIQFVNSMTFSLETTSAVL